MNQRHFCVRTHHRSLFVFLYCLFLMPFIFPDLAFSQDTLYVKFQWVTRSPNPDIDYYGKTPGFPRPIISYVKVSDEKGLHVPGLASINNWLTPDSIAEIGIQVRDIWKHITEYHVEDPLLPVDRRVSNFEVREVREKGVSVALAMDFSRTTSTNKLDQEWPEVIDAGKAFINELQLDGDGDRASLVKIDYIATEEHPFTDVRQDLINEIDGMRGVSGGDFGGSAILNGIDMGVQACITEPISNRRIVVIHSDGGETVVTNELAKQTLIEKIITDATVNDILVFTILVDPKAGEEEWGFLRQIADSTGGVFYENITKNDLDSVYTDIYSRLRGGYYLAHGSTDPKHDGTERWVDVDSLIVNNEIGSGRGKYRAPLLPSNVKISKAVFSDSVDGNRHYGIANETVRYELDITSNWHIPADSIWITDVFPDSLMNITIEREALLLPDSTTLEFSDTDFTLYPDSIVWHVPTTLDSGNTLRITYHAMVSPWMPLDPVELINTARVICANDTLPEDNEATQTLYGFGLPDLRVRCIQAPGTPSPHYPLILRAMVKNHSIVEAPNMFRVGFFNGSEQLEVQTLNGLSATDSVEVQSVWLDPPQGFHTIRVVVDLDNSVHESNELNNVDTCDGVLVGVDTLIVDVKKVAISDDEILGRSAGFPNPVLTWVDVLDQNNNFIHGLASTTQWLSFSDRIQLDNTTLVDSVWNRIWEYHRTDTARPNNPNVKNIAFGVVEIDEMGEPFYVLSHLSSDTLKDADERVVDVTVAHFELAGRDTGSYTPPLGDGDLNMDKTAKSDSMDANNNWYVQPGDTVTYSVVVRNIGHRPATDVVVQDDLPDVLKFLSSDRAPESVQGDTLIRWRIDSIPVYGFIEFAYICLVEDTLRILNSIPLMNEATVHWTLDSNTSNDTARVPVTYIPLEPPDLNVTKGSNTETADNGDIIQYTVTVVNQGALSCRNTTFFDRLPAEVTFLNEQSGTASLDMSTNTLSWPSIDLKPDESKTFVYTCVVDTLLRRGSHYLTNLFWATSEDEQTPDNNADSVQVLVDVSSPKRPEIELSESEVEPGDTVRVRVRVHHDIVSKDLSILYESDGSTNTQYGYDFLQDSVLKKYEWKFVTPDFQNLDTQIKTDGVEEETVSFWFITTDHFGDLDTSNVATLIIRSPKEFYIEENVFRPEYDSTLRLEFKLSTPGTAEINIYDISGAFVKKFRYERLNAGQHYEFWDGKDEHERDMGSGIYVAILTSDKFQIARKFIVVR